jgi:hypothetical protein
MSLKIDKNRKETEFCVEYWENAENEIEEGKKDVIINTENKPVLCKFWGRALSVEEEHKIMARPECSYVIWETPKGQRGLPPQRTEKPRWDVIAALKFAEQIREWEGIDDTKDDSAQKCTFENKLLFRDQHYEIANFVRYQIEAMDRIRLTGKEAEKKI